MTNNPDDAPTEPGLAGQIFRWLQIIGLSFLAIFLLGVAARSTIALIEHGTITLKPLLVSLGSLALFIGCAWWVWALKPLQGSDEPVAPRIRATRRYWWISLGFGVLIGIVLSLGGFSEGDLNGIFSDGPLPAGPTIAAAIAYMIFVPIMGWLHMRSVDEHEAKANYEGAFAGIYTYSTIFPAWWALARADVVPPVQSMTIFLIVMSVWGIVWLVRRNL